MNFREKKRQLNKPLFNYLRNVKFSSYLVSPIIYVQIIPFLLLDIFITIYQLINFSIYKIDKVERRNYIILDHHKLTYLNSLEKLNCLYCSYINGLIGYVREIASRSEQYFCPIRHASKQLGGHSRYHLFTNYGDAEGYREKLPKIRNSLRKIKGP